MSDPSASPPRVAIVLPERDFDVTEVATPWHEFRASGFEVAFATASGAPGSADPLLLTGVVFGQLGAAPEAVRRYERMLESPEFQAPLRFEELEPEAFDAFVLPGGHAPGMREFLESEQLQRMVVEWFRRESLVGAICHGPLVLARTIDPATGRSVIHDHRLIALPKLLERAAWLATAWKHGSYYRTYRQYVQDELVAALRSPDQFVRASLPTTPRVVRDRNLVTARWPGDAEAFARELVAQVRRRRAGGVDDSLVVPASASGRPHPPSERALRAAERLPVAMALARLAIGLLAALAPRTSMRLLALPASHDTSSARLAIRMFALRDVVLGAQLLASRADRERMRSLLPFNAAVECGDLVMLLMPLARRDGIDRRGLVGGALVAGGGAVLWLWAWRTSRFSPWWRG